METHGNKNPTGRTYINKIPCSNHAFTVTKGVPEKEILI